MSTAARRPICGQVDVEAVRRAAAEVAARAGFDPSGIEEIVLISSELAANILRYARGGTVTVSAVDGGRAGGVAIEAVDSGPGIADVTRAFGEGYSTGGGLGHGLPLVGRLADEVVVATDVRGTQIMAAKWRR